MKSNEELKQAGFTESGAKRYVAATTDYCDALFAKSVALGDIDKAADTTREVTHEHVRYATTVLALRGQGKSPRQVMCQIGEYSCAALAGVGGGNLSTSWGVAMFGLSLTIGVILYFTRNIRSPAR